MFIYNQNLWNDLMSTVTLVLLSSVISIIIGVPLGVFNGEKRKSQKYHYTDFGLHANNAGFVYLIPAVAFFGIGMVLGSSPLLSSLYHQPFALRT